MSSPLLTTKLYIPPIRPKLVPRPRLMERLNAGLDRKLTLVSAPAGFGKTTLLSEWVADCGQPAAWISLDDGDNDPVRFLAYFIAALQTVKATIGEGALSALQSSQPPPVEESLTKLINQINFLPDFILILDDYHFVTAQPVHDILTFLLDHLPAPMHLVIATRADPPLPIARLRGRGQLTELRLANLRFTPDEATAFLNHVVGLDLSASDVAALASRTEGWISGLQMAAISMQGREDTARFIQAFTGSNRYILDYLVEEVLQRQSQSVQTFLLQTSILDRLSGSLCDAVVRKIRDWRSEIGGQAQSPEQSPNLQSQVVLEYLESSNLFIVPLDNERRWYRYHRLFTDLLRSRLHQTCPNLVPTLHLRASTWYEQNRLMAEAIHHAASAEDLERATDLIEQAAEATLMRSQVATFLNWVEMVPKELVRARPALYLLYVWALVLRGSPLEVIESHLQDIARSAGADEDTNLVLSKVAVMRAFIAAFQDQLPSAAEMSRQALERLPEDDSYLRNVARWVLGMTHMMGGDIASGTQIMDEVVRKSQEIGNVLVTASVLIQLAELHRQRGQLHEAKATYERVLALATDDHGHILPVAGKALTGLGKLWREWNDFETATRYLVEGIEVISQWRKIAALEGHLHLARIKQTQGNWIGARDAIEKARQLAVEFDASEIDDRVVDFQQVRLWIRQGDTDPSCLEAAMRWFEERGLALSTARGLDTEAALVELAEMAEKGDDDSFSHRWRRYEHITLAQVLIKQGQPDEALALLEPILGMIERQGQTRTVISVQILRALAFQAQNDIEQAMTALERALSLAEPGGYVRTFVDEGEQMARLLRRAVTRGIAVEYASQLLAAFGVWERGRTGVPPPPHSPPTLTEPLSERELEVLRLLTTTLSTPEIAQELVVSVHTVRSHVKSIYSKLDVHRRAEAVQRAKELGLL